VGPVKFLLAIFLVGSSLVQVSVAQNLKGDYLRVHNKARAKVGVPPLQWSNRVAAYAQKYANSRIEKCVFDHSNGPFGENIAEGYEVISGVDAVNMWVGEEKNYDHKTNSCVNDECGHYTQVVWRNTKYLGCARVKCKSGWIFITCNYDPPGNYEGEKPY